MSKGCPTCGLNQELLFELTKHQIVIYLLLSRAGAKGLTSKMLLDLIYKNDPEGGPLHAEDSARSNISKMMKILRKHGLTITTEKTRVQRLEKLR